MVSHSKAQERSWLDKNRLYTYMSTFVTSAFLGWLFETIYVSIRAGHLVDRGLLTMPICPIYGFGVLTLKILFGNPQKGWRGKVRYFFQSALLLTTVEFIGGAFLKYGYGQQLWSYAHEIGRAHV